MLMATKMAAVCCLFLGFILPIQGKTSNITLDHDYKIHINEYGGKTIEVFCYANTTEVEVIAITIYNESYMGYRLAYVDKGNKCKTPPVNVTCTGEISDKYANLSMNYTVSWKSEMYIFYCAYIQHKGTDFNTTFTKVKVKEENFCNPGSGGCSVTIPVICTAILTFIVTLALYYVKNKYSAKIWKMCRRKIFDEKDQGTQKEEERLKNDDVTVNRMSRDKHRSKQCVM